MTNSKALLESSEVIAEICELIISDYNVCEDLKGQHMLNLQLNLPYLIEENRKARKELGD